METSAGAAQPNHGMDAWRADYTGGRGRCATDLVNCTDLAAAPASSAVLCQAAAPALSAVLSLRQRHSTYSCGPGENYAKTGVHSAHCGKGAGGIEIVNGSAQRHGPGGGARFTGGAFPGGGALFTGGAFPAVMP